MTTALHSDGFGRFGPVRVGWLLNEGRGGGVYDAPLRVHSVEPSRGHAKSASRRPAPLQGTRQSAPTCQIYS